MPNGGSVATFAIATNRYKKSDGSHAEQAEFHNTVVFGCTPHQGQGRDGVSA